jgi:type IV pilus assembly protein PilB
MVIRLLVQGKQVPSFEDLGMSKNLMRRYEKLCAMSSGIIIVTGPTGSGKTTTLFSTLDSLNDDAKNITTVEDPPEYMIHGVNQVKVESRVKAGEKQTGITFPDAIKSILRQDPDIIMLGEIRDEESAEVAVTASLTGHLVFSTLHTNSAIACIPRFLDLKIKPSLLSSTLLGVVAQRLVRKTCTECKKQVRPNERHVNFLAKFIKDLEKDIQSGKIKFFRGKGCPDCNYTGFKGRLAILELLSVNDEVSDAILRGDSVKEIENIARQKYMTSIIEDGFLKVAQGLTSIDEMLDKISSLKVPEKPRSYDQIYHLLEADISDSEIMASILSA